MSKVSRRPSVVMPTTEEDKAITAAAKTDPDAQPLVVVSARVPLVPLVWSQARKVRALASVPL